MSHWTQTKWDIWKFYVSNGAKTQPWQNTAPLSPMLWWDTTSTMLSTIKLRVSYFAYAEVWDFILMFPMPQHGLGVKFPGSLMSEISWCPWPLIILSFVLYQYHNFVFKLSVSWRLIRKLFLHLSPLSWNFTNKLTFEKKSSENEQALKLPSGQRVRMIIKLYKQWISFSLLHICLSLKPFYKTFWFVWSEHSMFLFPRRSLFIEFWTCWEVNAYSHSFMDTTSVN